MDYIKNLYDYFLGSTTDRPKENPADLVKNESLLLGDNKPPDVDNSPGAPITIGYGSAIMRIFFGDSEYYSNQSDLSSGTGSFGGFGTGSFGGFGSDMFNIITGMHEDISHLVNELHNEISSMQSFIIQGSPNGNLEGCSNCDEQLSGESLRNYYFKVPPLESIKSDNKCDNLAIVNPNPDRDGEGMMSSVGPPNSGLHFSHVQPTVASVHFSALEHDGVLEITRITRYSNGKTEKTVTTQRLT